jgi:hypothetical protein
LILNTNVVKLILKSIQAGLEQSLQTDHAEQVAQDRTSFMQRLDSAQASLQKLQAELDSERASFFAGRQPLDSAAILKSIEFNILF